MPFQYMMVQIAQGIVVSKKRTGSEWADTIQMVANQQAAQGWEFQRMDCFETVVEPGCLGGLFGAKRQVHTDYVMTFRRQV